MGTGNILKKMNHIFVGNIKMELGMEKGSIMIAKRIFSTLKAIRMGFLMKGVKFIRIKLGKLKNFLPLFWIKKDLIPKIYSNSRTPILKLRNLIWISFSSIMVSVKQ